MNSSFPLPSPTRSSQIDVSKRVNLTEICQTLLMVSVAYDQGADQGRRMRGMHILPPAIFKNVFDVCNFSIISNLFVSLKHA